MPGAVVNGVYEKNITLDIAKRVYNQLNGGKIKVYVTRFTDSYVDNYKRAYMLTTEPICLYQYIVIQ